MECIKKLASVIAVLVAVLVADTGIASATELDNSSGMGTAGTTILAQAETKIVLHPPIGDIECEESTVDLHTATTGSSTETIDGPLSTLSFGKCNATVQVLAPNGFTGRIEIHKLSPSNGNGTLTSNGSEVTVEFIGTHCIYSTSNTDIGLLTGSVNTKSTATVDISATIPRTGGRSGAFCGSDAVWTGAYLVKEPDALTVT